MSINNEEKQWTVKLLSYGKHWLDQHGHIRKAEYGNFTAYYTAGCDGEGYHNLNGPAVVWRDGRQEWYYFGKHINCTSQKQFESFLKMKAFW